MAIKDYFNKIKKVFSSKTSVQVANNLNVNSDKPLKADALQEEVQRLNAIIATQSLLAKAKFEKEAFINLVVQQMLTLTPASGAVVELAEGDDMVYKAATGVLAAHIGLRLKRKNSLSGLCVEQQKILYCEDTEHDPRVNLEACRRVNARSMIVAPLFQEGRTIGVLKILAAEPKAFSERDVETLQLMAGLIGAAIGNQIHVENDQKQLVEKIEAMTALEKEIDRRKVLEEKLTYLAKNDPLTTLLNRGAFQDRLQEAMQRTQRTKRLMALMYIDVDHFKSINDKEGHIIGDELLKAFAERLKSSVRVVDTVARIGGDEFVIIMEEVKDPSDLKVVAEKIIESMRKEFSLNNIVLYITASIGIASYLGVDITSEQLIEQADKALYEAKQSGRNTFRIAQTF